jgi:Uma2 family endonuclease
MTHLLQPKIFTVAEYYKLAEVGILKDTDKVELINGEIITMSPMNAPHAIMVAQLARILNKVLDEKAVVFIQSPIKINNHSEPEPDLIVAKFKLDFYKKNLPSPKETYIVIEVSDSTLDKDRAIKVPLYANANIPEYWIINLVDKQIEMYRQPKNGEYHFKQIISEKNQLIEANALGLKFNYQDIFINV